MAPSKRKAGTSHAGGIAPGSPIKKLTQRGIGEFVGKGKAKAIDDVDKDGIQAQGKSAPPGGKVREGGKAGDLKTESTPPGGVQPSVDGNTDPLKPYIIRNFYPPEMTIERARQYSDGIRERPIETVVKALKETEARRKAVKLGEAVIHWFRVDLRVEDNSGLALASLKATSRKEKPAHLIGLYIVSPQDWDAHIVSPAQLDFIFRNLKCLKDRLKELNIPLKVLVVQNRKRIPDEVLSFAGKMRARHIFTNMCYEVDELRMDAKIVKAGLLKGISFEVVHDTCVVTPGALSTKTGGKQFAVYTPWYKAWVVHVNENVFALEKRKDPTPNDKSAAALYANIFNEEIPEIPKDKQLDTETSARLAKLFPEGEVHAYDRLKQFIATKAAKYKLQRDIPGIDGCSAISPYLAIGVISARICIRETKKANRNLLKGGTEGHDHWISEVAWREFYKHILVNWPHICMNKPFKPEYTNIQWNYNPEHFKAWIAGRTGYPIVDAAMRHLAHDKWLPNRCRMIVASFLAKDLLLDWRMGEHYFLTQLIDGDFASNNGGWGFCSSAGVDPQPYFRIFNPLLQSKKFDVMGTYIRKWVPELRTVKGDAIHEPGTILGEKEVLRLGYVMPLVDHKEARELCLARYKAGTEK